MTSRDTKDNAGLTDFIPVLKQITITKNNRTFSFLYIVFYWKNNLKLCFYFTPVNAGLTDFIPISKTNNNHKK